MSFLFIFFDMLKFVAAKTQNQVLASANFDTCPYPLTWTMSGHDDMYKDMSGLDQLDILIIFFSNYPWFLSNFRLELVVQHGHNVSGLTSSQVVKKNTRSFLHTAHA